MQKVNATWWDRQSPQGRGLATWPMKSARVADVDWAQCRAHRALGLVVSLYSAFGITRDKQDIVLQCFAWL